jgi:hypothetical protein
VIFFYHIAVAAATAIAAILVSSALVFLVSFVKNQLTFSNISKDDGEIAS